MFLFNSNIKKTLGSFQYKFHLLNLNIKFQKFNFNTINTNNNMISYEIIPNSDNIGLLKIKNSAKRNALNFNLILGLINQLTIIDENFHINKGPRVLILSTEGDIFSSGHDLKELNTFDEVKRSETFENCAKLMLHLNRIKPIVIAEVQGLATAAGCQLAASCDLIVGTNKAKFECPGIKLGLFCSTPGVPLVRAIGYKKAMQMLVTAEPIDSKKAYDWGLLNEIIDIENLSGDEARLKLREGTLELANKINKYSFEALSYGKKIFYEQAEKSKIEDSYAIASNAMSENLKFNETKEGIKSFLEKKKPIFNK
jgi:enoyl-CoA hydratase/carnithine racemase